MSAESISFGGAYIVERNNLRLTFVSLGLLFPPQARFEGTTLPDLYAALCSRHTLEHFAMHGDDGATISTEGRYELDLKRDRLALEEQMQRSFDLTKRDFADMVGIVQDRLQIPVFVEPRIELRALWPIPDGQDAYQAMRERGAIGLTEGQFDLLPDTQIDAVGIEVRAGLGEQGHLTVEVMPWYQDPTQLYIEMGTWHHSSIETPALLEERLQETYDYFRDHVTRFISSFTA